MLTNFRKLNKVEKELMDKQFKRSDVRYHSHWEDSGGTITDLKNKLSVSYQVSDPFSVCVVKNGSKRSAGVAKRVRYAPMEDQFSKEKAMTISFSSAIRTFLEEV